MSVADPTQPTAQRSERPRPSLAARAGLLIVALVAEKSALDLTVDFQLADAAHGFATVLRLAQHFGLRFAVSFAVALAFFISVHREPSLHQINSDARAVPLRPAWLAAHLALLIPVAAASYNLYGSHGVRLPFLALSLTAVLLMIAAVLALLTALAPWQMWRRAAAAIGIRWAYAGLAALCATGAILWSQSLWRPTAQLTFQLVQDILAPILPTLEADAATRILSTPRFAIEVSSICSGLEGVGLMLAFCAAWLLYFRAEYRFPRALLIIPAGILLVFALNVARIAALMLIGNAGHPAIALYGFHSQAGWIAFNCAACGVAFASRRSHWLSRAAGRAPAAATPNPTAAYLLPFLAVLAAGMLARAISSGFETWYALRLAAAAAALACCWKRLARLDWRCSWRGITVGAATFALWLAASRLILSPRGMPAPLGAMSVGARDLWIATRALGGILVTPLVEELAYRGYLLRRLVAEDFEAVSFGTVGWAPLLVTAITFGVLQGPLWLPGTAAGLAYGLVLIRTGRMGEAFAAHLTRNLLIAGWVLAAGQWQLW